MDVGADLAVNLDQTLLANGSNLLLVECVLQSVSDQDDQRDGLTELVRSSRGARCLEAQTAISIWRAKLRSG